MYLPSMSKVVRVILIWLLGSGAGITQNIELKVDRGFTKTLQQAEASHADVYSFIMNDSDPFFFPEDLRPILGTGRQHTHIRKLGNRLVAIPAGTGRVYTITTGPSGIQLKRQDNTSYIGYNFEAYPFVYRDTLYSFGGYGFWKYNGLLRYFQESIGSWDVRALNEEILAHSSNNYLGQWVNSRSGRLFYLSRAMNQPHIKTNVVPTTTFQDTSRLHILDLQNRKWSGNGQLNPELIPILQHALKVGELPNGELVISGRAGSRKVYLLDYEANAVRQLKEPQASQLCIRVFSNTLNKLSWYSNDSLHIGPVAGETVFHLPLTRDAFVKLPYDLAEKDFWLRVFWMRHGLMVLLLSSGTVFGFLIGRRRFRSSISPDQIAKDTPTPIENLFNPYEVTILRGFLRNGNCLLPEEVNIILETDRKSLEVQKKYRSESIRGINEKTGKQLNTDKRLILQDRLADDRRQFIYRLNEEVLEALRGRTTGW